MVTPYAECIGKGIGGRTEVGGKAGQGIRLAPQRGLAEVFKQLVTETIDEFIWIGVASPILTDLDHSRLTPHLAEDGVFPIGVCTLHIKEFLLSFSSAKVTGLLIFDPIIERVFGIFSLQDTLPSILRVRRSYKISLPPLAFSLQLIPNRILDENC